MLLNDAKAQFYNILYRKIDNNEISSNEFISFIDSHRTGDMSENTSDFFELCAKFADVSLNASKIADSKTCEVRAHFKFADVNAAKSAFKKYMADKELTDTGGVLDMIGIMHSHAVASDDPRITSGLVSPKDYNYQPGFSGIYYNFKELPDDMWNIIKNELIEEAK